MTGSYGGSGEASYHPSVLLGILVYGYATGVFSSRKLERVIYDSVAFRFVAQPAPGPRHHRRVTAAFSQKAITVLAVGKAPCRQPQASSPPA